MSELAGGDDDAGFHRAAYIHIPFCRQRCPYCDFAVVDLAAANHDLAGYVDAVVAEIGMEPAWEPLHAVNLGGGTPTALTPMQLGRLVEAVSSRFGLADAAEISIEANPEDWSDEYAASLSELGFNRVSLGVQSFDAAVLRSLGRAHSPGDGVAAVGRAHAAGFEIVNLDLIFGTPGESAASWRETVDTALELGTKHLSAYALTVELGTALSRAVAAGAAAPDDDDQADKYELLCSAAAPRLRHYEVSNWSLPGYECRYNQTTWAQGEYLAFGLGAHGYRHGTRRRNVRRLDAYLRMVADGVRPEAGRERRSEWEREKERVFLGLRRRSGVVAGQAGQTLLESAVGKRFLSAGVVDQVGERIVVANPLLTDAVARELLAL